MWRISTLGRSSLSWALHGGNPAVYTGASPRVGSSADSTASPAAAAAADPLPPMRRMVRESSAAIAAPALGGHTLLSNLDALVDSPHAAAPARPAPGSAA